SHEPDTEVDTRSGTATRGGELLGARSIQHIRKPGACKSYERDSCGGGTRTNATGRRAQVSVGTNEADRERHTKLHCRRQNPAMATCRTELRRKGLENIYV